MRADAAEMSWDTKKGEWLLRISVGDEVIRRHCGKAKDVDDQNLRILAEKTVRDEGYEIDSAKVSILR
jgi:Fe2+ or Zn2+ uptake regulation protein